MKLMSVGLGIGAACAEYFAKEQALLSLVGRKLERFAVVVASIKQSGVKNEPLVIGLVNFFTSSKPSDIKFVFRLF